MSTLFEQLIEESSDTIKVPMELQNGDTFVFEILNTGKIALRKKPIELSTKKYTGMAKLAINPNIKTADIEEFREFAVKAGFTEENISELHSEDLWRIAATLHHSVINPELSMYQAALLVLKRSDVARKLNDAVEANSKDGTVYYEELKKD